MSKWRSASGKFSDELRRAASEVRRLERHINALEDENEQLRSQLRIEGTLWEQDRNEWRSRAVAAEALANPERVNNGCSIYRSPES